ncbi:MAG TPA: substrate-binding domain-containing protein [Bryobacteraceae bacterium]|nr:substrate-binding domain-containing protein [Bryobacteraceae bacterium]
MLRACQILRAFREHESLRLRDVVERTSLSKTTVFRILTTLECGGLLERSGPLHFRARSLLTTQRPFRIGFAAQTSTSTFSRLVSESIRQSAQAHGVELIELNNRHSVKVALQNAEMLIAQRVDLVLEFQGYETAAPIVSSKFLQADVPVIAIEIPHPGATFFGADNYRAGLIGGRALAKWTRNSWHGQLDEVILLEERAAGALPCSRVTGMLAGIRAGLPNITEHMIHSFDGQGASRPSLEAVRRHLRKRSPLRTLVAAHNDPSALGALRAMEECGRTEYCAVISQSSIPEGRAELRRPGSRLIGSVAYFPERYGEQLIPLALSILSGTPTPTTVYADHVLVTPRNVDRLYPHDA